MSEGGNPIRIRRLDHVVIRVADLERAMRFYRDALGCAEVRRNAEIGLYQLSAGESLIDLVPLDSPLGRRAGAGPPSGGRNVDHIALALAAFDEAALRAHLAAHGIAAGATARRFGAEGSGPSIYIEDPDGNVVELKGPPEAADG